MTDRKPDRQSELQGGLKATTRDQGRGEPKIGVDEFMSVAERFGFAPGTLDKIRAAVEAEDIGEGPFLANYYAKIPETKVQAMERVARQMFGVGHAIALSSGRRRCTRPLSRWGSAPAGRSSARPSAFSPRRRRWCNPMASPSFATWTSRCTWTRRKSRR